MSGERFQNHWAPGFFRMTKSQISPQNCIWDWWPPDQVATRSTFDHLSPLTGAFQCKRVLISLKSKKDVLKIPEFCDME